MRTIRWGMIGCGDVTEVKSGPGFYKAANSMLYGVMNRTLGKAYDYAGRHPVSRVYETAEELIGDDNIDAVYIATPPSSHKRFALLCAQAGKVCYIEKPMALNYKECTEIIDAFKKTNTKAFVAYYRRRLERFMKVKDLVESGEVGRVRFVEVSYYRPADKQGINGGWRVNPEISGGGIFMDIAVHALDALDFILGEIKTANGICRNQAGLYEAEDNVCACFAFENSVTGTGIWCFNAFKQEDRIQIVGEKGRISFECFGKGPVLLETEAEKVEFAVEMPVHVHQNLIQSIVDELNGIGSCPSTVESAARTAKVCDMIYGRL